MLDKKCRHSWQMANIRYGFLVTEKCRHCEAVETYFSIEDVPPKEEHREGDHFWRYLGSTQTVKFDLRCERCQGLVDCSDMLALMYCMKCSEKCNVCAMTDICESQSIMILVALTSDVRAEARREISLDTVTCLSQYFNDRIRTVGKKILILPDWMRQDPTICKGEVLQDVGMFQMEPPEVSLNAQAGL